MLKLKIESIYRVIMGLMMPISIAVSSGAADETTIYDTVELENGDILTGTVLDNTFTLTTPYSLVTLKKDQISEIRLQSGGQSEDVIELNVGGTIAGMIEETTLSLKLISGESISLEKKQCKKIILKRNE